MRRLLLGLTVLPFATLAFACGGGAAPTNESVGQNEAEVIGGVDAKSSKLDAIGTMVAIFPAAPQPAAPPSGGSASPSAAAPSPVRVHPSIKVGKPAGTLPDGRSFAPLCTGTIIGETTILTAKHCVQFAEENPQYTYGFAIGWNSNQPSRVVNVVDMETENTIPAGGLIGLGADVAVLHLGAPVTGLDYYSVATLAKSDVGTRYAAIGYGTQNVRGDYGTRKTGSLTLRGVDGKIFEAAFGNFAAFLKRAPGIYGVPQEVTQNPEWVAYFQSQYDETMFLAGYEAFLGLGRGDAQVCHGDSGGPLVGAGRKIYGVASYVLKSNGIFCEDGSGYATFGPAAVAFVENALTWVDECPGVDFKGTCEGDSAVRCTDRKTEGGRYTTRTDCSILGQTCGRGAAGQVECVDP